VRRESTCLWASALGRVEGWSGGKATLSANGRHLADWYWYWYWIYGGEEEEVVGESGRVKIVERRS